MDQKVGLAGDGDANRTRIGKSGHGDAHAAAGGHDGGKRGDTGLPIAESQFRFGIAGGVLKVSAFEILMALPAGAEFIGRGQAQFTSSRAKAIVLGGDQTGDKVNLASLRS